jgi:transcriptional regulator with PAS, ATPase and Fis domain
LSNNYFTLTLRVLQEKEIMRVGSNKNIPVDVRVIAATNADLSKAIKEGKFREDLFYRLSILPIYIPPLRDRKEDIPLLVKSFIAKFNDEYGRNIVDISEEALRILQSHDWPGNVRELENTIGRAIIYMNINEKVIDTIHLPHFNKKKSPVDDRVIAYEEADSLESVLSKTEAEYIKKLYYKLDKNKTRTAKELGISIRSLYYKMEKYGIS